MMRHIRIALVVLLPFLMMNVVYSVLSVAAMMLRLFKMQGVAGEEFAMLATFAAPCIAITAGHVAAAAWVVATAKTALAANATKAPSRLAACAVALAVVFGGWRCIEPLSTDTPLSSYSYPIVVSFLKTSAQRSERLKVEEKNLERPERTRRSREDRERIFDDGFESRSSCAEVFFIDGVDCYRAHHGHLAAPKKAAYLPVKQGFKRIPVTQDTPKIRSIRRRPLAFF
jgi:hypothetical protein